MRLQRVAALTAARTWLRNTWQPPKMIYSQQRAQVSMLRLIYVYDVWQSSTEKQWQQHTVTGHQPVPASPLAAAAYDEDSEGWVAALVVRVPLNLTRPCSNVHHTTASCDAAGKKKRRQTRWGLVRGPERRPPAAVNTGLPLRPRQTKMRRAIPRAFASAISGARSLRGRRAGHCRPAAASAGARARVRPTQAPVIALLLCCLNHKHAGMYYVRRGS